MHDQVEILTEICDLDDQLQGAGLSREDREGLTGALHALRWVLGSEQVRPSVYNVPANLTESQRDGLACIVCGATAVAGPPMVPVDAHWGLFRCAGGCMSAAGGA